MTNRHSTLSRRQFVARTTLASSALALWGGGTVASRAAGFSELPVAVFSKVYQELKLDFAQAAEVTAQAGLDGVDCPVRPRGEILPERAADDLPRYAEALRGRQARLLLLTTGIVSPTSPHATAILRTARQLGVKYYRLGSPQHKPGTAPEKQVQEIKSQLKDLAALNQELGMCAVFQNHSPGARAYVGGDLGELHAIIQDFNPEQIGVAFDLGHALIVHGRDWKRHFEQLKPHIRVAYVKDVKRGQGFVRFGEGDFAETGYFGLLKQMGYNAPFSIHIEFDWEGADGGKTRAALIQVLRQSLKVLRQWLADA